MKTHYYTDEILQICDKKHLTTEEIFYLLKLKYDDIGISSVYRNLERLVIEGKLKKVEGLNKKSYFEKYIGEHIHFIDEDTGEIHDVYNIVDLHVDIPSHFSISKYDIKIYGKIAELQK